MKASHWWMAGAVVVFTAFAFKSWADDGVVKIDPEVTVSGVRPFGVNLGFRTSWGAEQLISNVLMNPGFEGIVDRCLVTAVPLDRYRFLEQSDWLGRTDQFWVGATFQVRTGPAAGYTGTIVASKKSGAQGLPEFTARDALPPSIEPGDRIALTKVTDDGLPTQWWIPSASAGQVAVIREARPLSAGIRSLQLRAQPNSFSEIHSYLDAIGDRAGVLLPITGTWRLSFWSRSPAGAELAVRFARDGGRTWVDRTIAVSPRWQQNVVDFEGGEDGARGILDLRFQTAGEVLLDDVELRKTGSATGPFRREVVETLSALRPAYLRDWQGQLGDTLENRLAPSEARRASRYRPGGDEATDFLYSLPEFLDLCRQVQTSPWIVIPPTFTDQEWTSLGQYLLSRAGDDRFAEILVEFGNENWNPLFAAAGITDIDKHAEAAGHGFRALIDAAGTLPIKAVMNAQYDNPDSVVALADRLTQPAIIAVAPYFFRSISAGETSGNMMSSLFAGSRDTLHQITAGFHDPQQELAAYEINLHTTDGDAPGSERTPLVAGEVSASALASHLLDGLAAGVRRQCVYVLAGFDFELSGQLGYTPLWGITRDLAAAHRLRPTGLALALLNQAVAGDLHKSRSSPRNLTVAAFRSESGWSAAIVSAAREPREVRLEFPENSHLPLPSRCLVLRSPNPLSTNEDGEGVIIAEEPVMTAGRVVRLQLPAYGLAVLLPKEKHER